MKLKFFIICIILFTILIVVSGCTMEKNNEIYQNMENFNTTKDNNAITKNNNTIR